MLPYFRKLEGHHRSGPLHGTDGPLRVSQAKATARSTQPFIAAGQQAGYPSPTTSTARSRRLRPLRPDDRGRTPLDRGRGVPVPRPRPPQPDRGDERPHTRIHLQGGRRGRGRLYRRARDPARNRLGENPDLHCAVQSPQLLQLSASAIRLTCAASASRRCMNCPAWAATCRTTSTFIMNWRSRGLRTVFSEVKGLRQLGVGLRYALTGKGVGRQNFSRPAPSSRRARAGPPRYPNPRRPRHHARARQGEGDRGRLLAPPLPARPEKRGRIGLCRTIPSPIR